MSFNDITLSESIGTKYAVFRVYGIALIPFRSGIPRIHCSVTNSLKFRLIKDLFVK